MTPSPETLALLLALPLDARRKLAAAEGPGWAVSPEGQADHDTGSTGGIRSIIGRLPTAGAWLPASEAEIRKCWEADDPMVSIRIGVVASRLPDTLDFRLRAALLCCPSPRP